MIGLACQLASMFIRNLTGLSVEALEMVKEGQNLVARRTFNELYTCVLQLLVLAVLFPSELPAENANFSWKSSCRFYL